MGTGPVKRGQLRRTLHREGDARNNRLTQVRAEIRSSTLRQQSKITDAAAYAKLSKIRWAGYVMCLNENSWTRAVSD
ncbi:hypothetical protein ANCDUO_12821 [Ancylostoma duodenale]|uniref:Uncharacterized protein n=1 Tax=Ancylostoma duodenale TaxID=51022 RepID=A0A0C2G7R5_9BILA|nr:hypothetical protein ANCDUO_12821 [Ancylostoma duodenale]